MEADSDRTLLDFLRRDLGLTGAKNGCDGKGTCGACTVVVSPGRAVKSCRVPLVSLDQQEILTIEGLSKDGLHPLQVAFINTGAIQCGFCTPGMIMAARALLDSNPNPSDEEIAEALQGNLCRCTGYIKIVQAVKEAAKAITSNRKISVEEASEDAPKIGAPIPAKMSLEKATGAFQFLDDVPAEEALVGKVVWSQHDHANILGINIKKALAVRGVVAVLTARDVPGQNAYGSICDDQPVLCSDRVRYRGDPVALVLAETAEAACEGAALVSVDYAPLALVFEPEDALRDGAPQLFAGGNLACEFVLKNGDTKAVIENAHLVVADEFTTPAVEHAYLEPEGGIAEWNDGKVTVRSACQYPRTVQRQIARILNQPKETVRIISHPTGGAFGGKTDMSIHPLLALAATHVKRSVKIVLSREESLQTSVKRHPMRMRYEIAFDREGCITAIKADILANAGAYYTLSIPLLEQTAAFSTGPYRVPNTDIVVRGAFTNTPPASAFRGFGIPQPTFAVESLIDEAATKLGLSPIDIRRRNALRPGDRSPTGQSMGIDTHLLDTLDVIKGEYQRLVRQTDIQNVGVGIACGYKNVGLGLGEDDYAEASVEILPNRRVHLRVGAIDLGQGSSTILAQLAAHELAVPYQSVTVESGDTERTPDARETNASRQSVMSGNALMDAIRKLKQRVIAEAKERHPSLQPVLSIRDGCIIDASGRRLDLFELAYEVANNGERLTASGRYTAPKTVPLAALAEPAPDDDRTNLMNYFTFDFFANLAVVRVDPETGCVRTERIVSAYDVGKVLNRLTAEGQLEGGAVMGMGYALSEEYIAYGPKRTTTLAQCRLPRCKDTPVVITRFIEPADSVGPYGAKGMGEVAMIAIAPAIANAIYHAVGIRIRSLPAKPAAIREALAK